MVWITSMSGNTQLQKMDENGQSQFGRGFNRTDSNQANAGFKSPQYPTIQKGLQNRLSDKSSFKHSLGSQSWDSTDLENE